VAAPAKRLGGHVFRDWRGLTILHRALKRAAVRRWNQSRIDPQRLATLGFVVEPPFT